MLNATEAFNEACVGIDREIKFRLVVPSADDFQGGFFSSDFSEDEGFLGMIKTLSIVETLENQTGISMGRVNSTQLNIDLVSISSALSQRSAAYMIGMTLFVSVSGNEMPIGTFYATEFSSADNFKTLNIVAYDFWTAYSGNLFNPQTLDYPTNAKEVADRLSYEKNIVEQSTDMESINIYAINNNTTEKTLLGYLGSLMLGNVRINSVTNDGTVTWGFSYYDTANPVITIDRDVQYINELNVNAHQDIHVGSLSITDVGLQKGNGTFYNISIENPWYTEDLLDSAFDKVTKIVYRPLTVRWKGNPAIQCGDVVLVEGTEGTMYTALVTQHTIHYDGGMSCTIECYGTSEEENHIVTSPMERKLNSIQQTVNDVSVTVDNHTTEINGIAENVAVTEAGLAEVKKTTDQVTTYFDFAPQGQSGLLIHDTQSSIGTLYGAGKVQMVDSAGNVLSEWTSDTFSIENLKSFRIGKLIIAVQSNGSVSFIGART